MSAIHEITDRFVNGQDPNYADLVLAERQFDKLTAENAELRRLAAVESDCAPYLKDGETPADRIKREIGDTDSLMNLYRDVVAERDALKAELEAEREESKRWLVKAQNERDARKELEAELERIKANPVHQFRKSRCADWFDGNPDHTDGGGPYETRTLYALGSKT